MMRKGSSMGLSGFGPTTGSSSLIGGIGRDIVPIGALPMEIVLYLDGLCYMRRSQKVVHSYSRGLGHYVSERVREKDVSYGVRRRPKMIDEY